MRSLESRRAQVITALAMSVWRSSENTHSYWPRATPWKGTPRTRASASVRSSMEAGSGRLVGFAAQALEDEPVAVDPADAVAAGAGGVGQVVGPDALAQARQVGVEGLAGHLGAGALGRPQRQLDLVGVVGVLVVQDQPAEELFDDAAVGRLAVAVVSRSGRGP